MRYRIVMSGLAALVIVASGVWWYHARAGRLPFLPSSIDDTLDDEPAGSGADPEPVGRLDLHRLVRSSEFGRLTQIVESRQARARRDVRTEMEVTNVVDAFQTADPTLTPLLDAWVVAAPQSYAPLLARARHHLMLAFALRGAKSGAETSDEQFLGMELQLESAIADARAVLERNARVAEAYAVLIDSARALGDQDACDAIAERGLTYVPASLRIRVAQAACQLPRWGGSYRQMDAVARSGDAYAADNPALPALHGFAAWDRGRIARGTAALRHLDEALAAGEHWFFYRDRARELLRQDRNEEALADANRALALAPDDPPTLVLRIRALAYLGRTAEAVPHVQLLNETDPGNRDLAVFQESALPAAIEDGHRMLEREKNASGAIDQFTMAIDVTGGNAEVFYWRGRAYLQSGDHDRALADFEEAIRQDPRHFESYRNIDYVLASRRDWNGVIRRWTQYLDLVPTDGRAYFERGGAANHKGDRPAALEDARKACELGVREACAAAGRAR